jgi:hypothetical protein
MAWAFRTALLLAMIWGLIMTLRRGAIPGLGELLRRDERPISYWFITICVVGVVAAMAITLCLAALDLG